MHLPLWVIAITLVLAGSLWLRAGIRRLINWAASPPIGKLPAIQPSSPFVVTKAGKFAIWQSRKTYGQAWVKMPTPIITSVSTGQRLLIHRAYSNVLVSGVGETRFQLFTFWAGPGDYQLEVPDPGLERTYALEIRAYKPTYQLVLAILLTILGAATLIVGIVILIQSVLPESRSSP
ncbi:hypothetical protein [Spirosoma sp.]|uniref:hypothetical protein n=1 Tax=Spirosoma sp. TaxID=1899569 RepID=UPI002607B9E0|nr:hypothetical protein [Spirosoma sp.]MCX6215285.1 hypothetical protein [Spirosoma sp.]